MVQTVLPRCGIAQHNAASESDLRSLAVLALIAHDQKKPAMVDFVRRYRPLFDSHPLVATGSTGRVLREEVGLDVECVAHGPDGGDLIIGGRVAEGKIRAVIFFRDPLTAQPHEPDVSALMRVCDVHNIPLATNLGTAEAIVDWLTDSMSSANP
jgi:methylglyoxal synthase